MKIKQFKIDPVVLAELEVKMSSLAEFCQANELPLVASALTGFDGKDASFASSVFIDAGEGLATPHLVAALKVLSGDVPQGLIVAIAGASKVVAVKKECDCEDCVAGLTATKH